MTCRKKSELLCKAGGRRSVKKGATIKKATWQDCSATSHIKFLRRYRRMVW